MCVCVHTSLHMCHIFFIHSILLAGKVCVCVCEGNVLRGLGRSWKTEKFVMANSDTRYERSVGVHRGGKVEMMIDGLREPPS